MDITLHQIVISISIKKEYLEIKRIMKEKFFGILIFKYQSIKVY